MTHDLHVYPAWGEDRPPILFDNCEQCLRYSSDPIKDLDDMNMRRLYNLSLNRGFPMTFAERCAVTQLSETLTRLWRLHDLDIAADHIVRNRKRLLDIEASIHEGSST